MRFSHGFSPPEWLAEWGRFPSNQYYYVLQHVTRRIEHRRMIYMCMYRSTYTSQYRTLNTSLGRRGGLVFAIYSTSLYIMYPMRGCKKRCAHAPYGNPCPPGNYLKTCTVGDCLLGFGDQRSPRIFARPSQLPPPCTDLAPSSGR